MNTLGALCSIPGVLFSPPCDFLFLLAEAGIYRNISSSRLGMGINGPVPPPLVAVICEHA